MTLCKRLTSWNILWDFWKPSRLCACQNVFFRSSHPEVLLGKGVLKGCSKFTGEHPYRSVISIKLLYNFIEITLRNGCPPVNLLHIFLTPFLKNTSRWLLLIFDVGFVGFWWFWNSDSDFSHFIHIGFPRKLLCLMALKLIRQYI